MEKSELIDWLIQNDSLTKEIVDKFYTKCDSDFEEESKAQLLDKVNQELCNELSKTKGLTISNLNVIITEKELRGYIDEVINYGHD